MKKLLIPILFALLPLWGCLKDGTYYAENAQDIVTVKDDNLVSDNGVKYVVTENASSNKDWKTEGSRYFMVFDILNAQLDIRIKSLYKIIIQEAEPAPTSETDLLPTDPVYFYFARLSPHYLDLGLWLYKAEGTECGHEVFFRYQDKGDEILDIHIYHNGNGENPVNMEESKLKTENRFYSIPLDDFSATTINVYAHMVGYDTEGKLVITEQQYGTPR